MGNIYPHEQGGFDDDEACACGNEHWIAYWVATQEVKMISDTARVSLNILRGFLVGKYANCIPIWLAFVHSL